MTKPYQMHIRDIFRFRELDRVVLAGTIENGPGYIPPGMAELWVDGEKRALLRVEGEMLSGGPDGLRAISTRATRCLNRESVQRGQWVLKSVDDEAQSNRPLAQMDRRISMHRHLIGLDSPPPEMIADPMTLGPALPEGWDGDAWATPTGRGYFLRAWSKAEARVAYGDGSTYEDARRSLLEDVARGGTSVEIAPREVVRG